jgi:hypothetical protein
VGWERHGGKPYVFCSAIRQTEEETSDLLKHSMLNGVRSPWPSHHPVMLLPLQESWDQHLHHWTERAWSWQRMPRLLQWSPGAPPVLTEKEASAWDRDQMVLSAGQHRPDPQPLQGLYQRQHTRARGSGDPDWGCLL